VRTNENTWLPSQVQAMTGFPAEQVLELLGRLVDYLGGWQPERGRRRELDLGDAVSAVVFYDRHNCGQESTGVVSGVGRSTVSRMVTLLEEPIAAALDGEVPEWVAVLAGRGVVIPDGTVIPTGTRAAHRELDAGKRHRAGAAVQVLVGTEGQLFDVGEPVAGSTHDVVAVRETGLAAVLTGHRAENPVRRPPKGAHSPAQAEANKQLSGMRAVVERCIAHLTNWKILATGYRRPRRKLALCLAAVTALEFYRLNWTSYE
jgi:hypothetical protein